MAMLPPLPNAGPGATPTAPTQPLAPIAPASTLPTTPPVPGLRFRGWYPRWWLLSGLFCSAILGLGAVFIPQICSGDPTTYVFPQTWICPPTTWTGWQQVPIMLGFWLLFLLGWTAAYTWGVVYIEIDRLSRGPIASLMRALSEFETTYLLYYSGAAVAFLLTWAMWYSTHFQLATFAVCSLLLFVGACCYMYRCPPHERVSVLGVTIAFALVCAILMFIIKKPVQPCIFIGEIVVIIVAIVGIVRRSPNPPASLTAANARTMTPLRVLLALLPFFRP